MSVEPRSPVERDIIEMSLESVKKGGNQHIVRKDDDDEKLGLLNIRAFFFLILWYIFSAFTLFLNKYILTTLKGDPAVLGTFFSFNLYFSCFTFCMQVLYDLTVLVETIQNYILSVLIPGCFLYDFLFAWRLDNNFLLLLSIFQEQCRW